MTNDRIIAWFSCGVITAIASKLILEKYLNAILAYRHTGSEYDDNKRFITDCEKWFLK